MNQMKTRLAALNLLDRALNALTDDELRTMIDGVPEDAAGPLASAIDVPETADVDAVPALRLAASRGRVNGMLEQLSILLCEKCLDDCIAKLGDESDSPSEDRLREVSHELVETHGVGAVRLMLASSVAGEANASAACVSLLKTDDVLKLPPPPPPRNYGKSAVVATESGDTTERAAIKERRKEEKRRKQAEATARREQSARARGK